MPRILTEIAHSLGRLEAKSRIEQAMQAAMTHYGNQISELEQFWRDATLDFRFKVQGFAVSGTLEVQEDRVRIDSSLPLIAAMFKGQITRSLETELGRVLA